MKKQKIKADNVDQLLEIVKAVQRGEDPGAAVDRMKAEIEAAEAIQEAERAAAELQKEQKAQELKLQKAQRQNLKKQEVSNETEDEAFEKDEFEQILSEEKADALSFGQAAKDIFGRIGAFSLPKKQGKKTEKKSEKKSDEKSEKMAVKDEELDKTELDETELEHIEPLAAELENRMPENNTLPESEIQETMAAPDMEDEEERTQEERTQEEISEDQEKLDRILEIGSGGGRMLGRERLSSHSGKADSVRKTAVKNLKDEADSEKAPTEKKAKGLRVGAVLSGLWKSLNEKESEDAEGFEEDSIPEETISDKAYADEFSSEATVPGTSDEETENNAEAEFAAEDKSESEYAEETAEENAEETPKETVKEVSEEISKEMSKEMSEAEETVSDDAAEKKASKEHSFKLDISALTALLTKIKKREISRKELTIAGIGVILLVLVVIIITNAVQNSMEEKKKRENVTADEGLIVTVENDPQEWCSSYPLELRFRTKGKPITKVIINDTALQPDADGNVTYAAAEHRLEATAVTEDNTYQAVIEIPKLDELPPVVNAQRSANQIILTASDTRSSIRRILYAELKDSDYIRLPVYQEYTGAISYKKGSLYYFYAEDAAGNCSIPMCTTMELAETIQFEEEEVMMYPGESTYLTVVEAPSGALLNNLQYTSMDPETVTVDARGKITALKEGNAVIKASADGVPEISCTVYAASERTVTISAIGDCTLGTDASFNTDTNFTAFDFVNGHDYFFQNVKAILENDDVTFANFEGTLTTATSREAKQYAFKGDPSYTEILTSGSVEVVTLANNHSSDYGEQSLTDTKNYLTEAGIDYCIGDTYVVKKVNGVKTAFIGIYVLRDGMEREEQVRQTIAQAKADGAELVVVGFHWGSEKATAPDETQKSLAHIAVDCGADLVVGHHPHVLQGIEKYNGKYIVYSLANFCFGGNNAPSDRDTMIFRQTFTISDGEVQTDDQIEIIPCSVSSAAGYNNYQPIAVSGDEAQRIMSRINEYSAEFGQTYTASTGL